MVGGGEVKVATVEVEASVDNMATLPVSRAHGGGGGGGNDTTAEKNNTTNKEMELKRVQPKPDKRTSLFIIMSFVYAKLLIVVCIAYVISDVVTHSIPLYYYEGFFTYLYGMSIFFLLYVFCFLLQESTCCSGEKKEKVKKISKEKVKEKEKEKKKEEKQKKKEEKEKKKKEMEEKKKEKDKDKDKKKDKKQEKQEQQPPPQQQPPPPPPPAADIEAGPIVAKVTRKRKTTQNDQSHGSFFLRIGAIAFGLGTMIYNGLEFGTFFEIPFTPPCYMILRGVNPVLQMIFTFMQMYFIFMNSRLNIHRFKVIARFGLMHVVATNICVWIRTVVIEYLKEITIYHKNMNATAVQEGILAESVRLQTIRNANGVLGTHLAVPDIIPTTIVAASTAATMSSSSFVKNLTTTTISTVSTTLRTTTAMPTIPTTLKRIFTTTAKTLPPVLWKMTKTNSSALVTSTTAAITNATARPWKFPTTPTPTPFKNLFAYKNPNHYDSNVVNVVDDAANVINGSNAVDVGFMQALVSYFNVTNSTENATVDPLSCGRVNIMGTIVQESAPYLFPFIIEYSLIGAAVIYVMWKHIGRNPRYVTEEDLEHRLEVMLSRRAVAMAHAQHGRVDCVGASKGLFFGLLMLVASLICLILFFVLIRHPDLDLLAIYLADVSHCVLMVLSIFAIFIGFIRTSLMPSDLNSRVQALKFKVEEQSDLNDILLRVSAFGLFLYAVFSVIAGSLNAFTKQPNLLVMITGLLSILQVILQLLFIADVSRRRVHLPEHDRSKPGRQIVTFLLICNVTMWIIYTFETKKVVENPVQLEFYGFLAWAIVQRITLPLCIFHRFHSAVTLAEIWKMSYKARLE
ncbi:proton channel OtopLc isoform X6 [Photinus pyralis]|uniref:proton channel OtopLc isoform X6 n=1 Tax=Photinus pyralis TaxID=7054 RepID=UPI00126775A3|nr:proton channel OtopLc isoform X6 [Photinus pyralis]